MTPHGKQGTQPGLGELRRAVPAERAAAHAATRMSPMCCFRYHPFA